MLYREENSRKVTFTKGDVIAHVFAHSGKIQCIFIFSFIFLKSFIKFEYFFLDIHRCAKNDDFFLV